MKNNGMNWNTSRTVNREDIEDQDFNEEEAFWQAKSGKPNRLASLERMKNKRRTRNAYRDDI